MAILYISQLAHSLLVFHYLPTLQHSQVPVLEEEEGEEELLGSPVSTVEVVATITVSP